MRRSESRNCSLELQVKHFYKADPPYGEGVAKGLGLDVRALAGEKPVAAD